MTMAKNLNLFLMDGTATGRVKCTLANWTGLVYKIPRTKIAESREISFLNQTGVYLLFGEDEFSGEPLVYVGQAGIRKNGRGILCRIEEHLKNEGKDWWNTLVAFTTSNNSFGPTEISYLENAFYRMALEAKRYQATNGNEPNSGNLTEEKESELLEYLSYARLVIGALGYPVFEPLRGQKQQEQSAEAPNDEPLLYCRRSGSDAMGQRTTEGFVLFKGSIIRQDLLPSCPDYVIKLRNQYADRIDANNLLTEDIPFSSSSTAAAFVIGSSANGNAEWKTAEGVRLGTMEQNKL